LRVFEPRNLRPYNQDQMALFPPSVKSLIEDDHLCIIVSKRDGEKATKIGAVRYLEKPVDKYDLAITVRQVLDGK
jgi:DNA-binding NtrC family response regulator